MTHPRHLTAPTAHAPDAGFGSFNYALWLLRLRRVSLGSDRRRFQKNRVRVGVTAFRSKTRFLDHHRQRRWYAALPILSNVAFVVPAAAADLPIPFYDTWVGGTSTDWLDPTNWNHGVPNGIAFTTVNTVNPNPTVISAGSSALADTLNIGPSGSLFLGGSLSVTSFVNVQGLLTISDTGVLTLNRIYFEPAGSYMMEVTSSTAARIDLSNQAALAGMLRVSSPTGTFSFNAPYTVLNAPGGLNATTFDSLTTPRGIGGTLGYTNTDVLLTLSSQLGQIPGLNNNQQKMGNAFDAAFNAAGSNSGFGALFTGNIPLNLTQASGETATGSQQTTFDAMGQFMGLLTDPFMQRNGSPASTQGASGYAEEASAYATTKKTDAFAMFTKAPPAPFDQRWSVWGAGYGSSQSTSGNAVVGSNNTNSSIAGTAVGADYLLSPNTVAGFALAGGGTNFSVANGGSGRSDLFQAGAYVRHTEGPAYISAALAYGWQDITTNRMVTVAGFDPLRAEFNANAYSGRLESGYRFVAPATLSVGITPYAAAQFVTFDLPAYAEQAIAGTNNFALAYGARDVTDVRSELGIRTDKSWATADGILTLRGRVAWAHDYDPDRSIAATFQTLPGASFVVNGAAQAADSALTTASVEMKWKNGWSTVATFEGEFSNVTSSYAGKGLVRYTW
jgi:uncharacterized protein with beta-barrel porin domain